MITANIANTTITAPTAVRLVGGSSNAVNVSGTSRIAGAVSAGAGTTTVAVAENATATFTSTVGSTDQRVSAL